MSKPLNTNHVPASLVSKDAKFRMNIIMLVVLVLYILSSVMTNSSILRFDAAFFANVWNMIVQLFPPNWSYAGVVVDKLLETIKMALIATTIAGILCIPFSLLAASNIAQNKFLYNFIKMFLNIMRTIPELILAVVFVGLFGIGVFGGILALIIFSLGILAKLISETIEAIDMNPLEAIRASGGNTLQVIWYAVVPQVLPQFVSFTLYVFEINVRASVVLGFVGAGGIGLILQQQLNFLSYQNVSTIIVITFIVVVIIDYISNKLRGRLV
ncbi:phosphonate ABC transporter, permease protein PhnE [Pseudalkalibacillus salsuginis]|uniref:phosphonate ABC transporter, permease protein PhnE n=1 Tax=Pseudalkalibacillus salsuginis TaxID=2910972 RepID=UPI001F3DD4C9|nr:phosphonate ABC transporter, permease protein PhnE [Pseudalkalibacillus salsuginis]MCF6411132.1 phosphonate ABC transporter, permease protein PhnE [Pseudalkalibacillus salsuginis]